MVIVGGCQPVEQATTAPVQQTITVHGFSIEEEVITEELFAAFKAYWLQQAGQEVTFQSTFTGSEDLTESIVDGAEADVALLSNEQHAVQLR